MMWQQPGHDGSAAQYPDWAIEGHANALTGLTSQPFWGFLDEATKQECLECHSADFRILEEGGENPTSADAMYGITCVGCHTPHENTTEGGAWDEEWTPQLRTGSAQTLCVECHNGELPEGTTAAPGTEIHHPMKEMMEGYGAIDVSAFPSVHKGKCVAVPHAADEHQPRQRAAGWQPHVQHHRAGSGPRGLSDPGGHDERRRDGVSERHDHHHQHGDVGRHADVGVQHLPQQQQRRPLDAAPVSTTTATPNPTASPLRVTVTVNQNANQSPWGNNPGGDRGLWLQDTIEQRQEWTKAKVAAIWAALDVAAVQPRLRRRLPHMRLPRPRALMAKPSNTWTTAERAFLSGFTNVEFVESEGSFGLHNWDYSREIVNTAMMQAKIAQTGVVVRTPWVVTLKMSRNSVNAGATVKFTGTVKTSKGVAGAGTVKIMRRISGTWQVWLKGKPQLVGQLLHLAEGHEEGYVLVSAPSCRPTPRASARTARRVSSWSSR